MGTPDGPPGIREPPRSTPRAGVIRSMFGSPLVGPAATCNRRGSKGPVIRFAASPVFLARLTFHPSEMGEGWTPRLGNGPSGSNA